MDSYLIDTHAHPQMIIELEQKKNKQLITHQDIIIDAKAKNVKKIFCISTVVDDFENLRNNARLYDPYYFSLGIHPCDIAEDNDDLALLVAATDQAYQNKEKLIGIGETGIDLFHRNDYELLLEQKKIFVEHIHLAINYNLPLIIHTRNATEITYDILRSYKNQIRGVIHAFCDDTEWAKKFIDLGFMLGIGGVVTYPKNDYIRDAIAAVGLNNILLETDSPFLPMQSMRGKINYPSYIFDISKAIASICGFSQSDVTEKIFNTSNQIFFKN